MVSVRKTRKNVYFRPKIAEYMVQAADREEMNFSELVDYACEEWIHQNIRDRDLKKAHKRLQAQKEEAMLKVPKTETLPTPIQTTVSDEIHTDTSSYLEDDDEGVTWDE